MSADQIAQVEASIVALRKRQTLEATRQEVASIVALMAPNTPDDTLLVARSMRERVAAGAPINAAEIAAAAVKARGTK